MNEHAKHWRKLAAQERERLTWDKYLLPAIAEARAKTYEACADSIEKTELTGVFHCCCGGTAQPARQCVFNKAHAR